ncbi:MAG TPA: hypothetical protein VIZ66_08055 [Sphingomicrobium sp.]
MSFLSRPRRPRRAHEWCAAKAVTFIVTLAATQSVTLAARRSGMSRKSAYALKGRDPAFAAAWTAALNVRSAARREGDTSDTSDRPRVSRGEGDIRTPRRNARPDAFARDRFFAELARRTRDSAELARRAPRQ